MSARSAAMAWAVVGVVLVVASAAWAQSPLARELEVVAVQYHRNPAQLDRVREGLEQAVKTDSHVENFIALSRACFLWGDIRATSREQKLEAYDRGRQTGKRAVELAPRSALAHLWYATNTARWGQVNGVVRSLFLLSTVREELDAALQLDPKLTAAHVVSGNVYYEVPGMLGGDLAKAEQAFRTALKQDAKFTAARVGLGKTLIKRGRPADARRELQAVLDETEPRNPADWTMKDSKDARELLDSIKDRK